MEHIEIERLEEHKKFVEATQHESDFFRMPSLVNYKKIRKTMKTSSKLLKDKQPEFNDSLMIEDVANS